MARNRNLALGDGDGDGDGHGDGRRLPIDPTHVVLAGVGVVVLLLLLLFMSGAQVPEGYVGVKTTWGRADEGVLTPGFHRSSPACRVSCGWRREW